MRTVERPPLPVWLRYRLFGLRVPERYVAWAEQDIGSASWPWKARMIVPLVTAGVVIVWEVATNQVDWLFPVAIVVGSFVGAATVRAIRRRPGIRQVIDTQRELAIRYQRGEISRREQNDLFMGRLTWRMALAAAACGSLCFIVLYVLDHQ